jgi:hypothetical protein
VGLQCNFIAKSSQWFTQMRRVLSGRFYGHVYATDIVRRKRNKVVQNLLIISEVKPKSTEFQGFYVETRKGRERQNSFDGIS